MVDLIYNFILNVLIGESSTIPGKTDIANLLTWSAIILIFFVLVKLVIWAFNVGLGRKRARY